MPLSICQGLHVYNTLHNIKLDFKKFCSAKTITALTLLYLVTYKLVFHLLYEYFFNNCYIIDRELIQN